jgi:hypothetical protein
MHAPVKWKPMSDYQTMDAMWLQVVCEVASIHLKADGGTPHSNFSNTP